MLRRLSSLFQRANPGQRLEAELESLEHQAESSVPDYQAHLFLRAGDLCADAADRDRALRYYGRAIDAYLEFGYYDVAASVCRKMIDVSPTVVRARCTLAFLSLGQGLIHLPFRGLMEDARREIGDYVRTAQRAGLDATAAERLHLMAEATDIHEIRELIGEYLLELGDMVGADRVFGSVYAERNDLQSPSAEDQRVRWARALQIPVPHGLDLDVRGPAPGVPASGTDTDAEPTT